MCGRFALPIPPRSIAEHFSLLEAPDFIPRYNVAPAQEIPIIVKSSPDTSNSARIARWGMAPRWEQPDSRRTELINARAETVHGKPSFRDSFRYRRCLIPATGFYEWRRSRDSTQPYYFTLRGGNIMALAGLWDIRRGGGTDSPAFTILTTAPNSLVKPVHNRMPVIVSPEDYIRWLDPSVSERKHLDGILHPFAPERMQGWPVSTRINNVEEEGEELVRPLQNDLFS